MQNWRIFLSHKSVLGMSLLCHEKKVGINLPLHAENLPRRFKKTQTIFVERISQLHKTAIFVF
jgi:hypothetical protein